MDPERSADALEQWVLATAAQAVAYATSLLRDRDRAEDIVQDCYCRLLQKADVYDLPRDGRKLLMRSITNACINDRTRRRPIYRLYQTSPNGDGSEEYDHDPADRSTAAPDAEAIGHELAESIAAGLARLPQRQRAALELRSLGYSQQEIAEILNLTLSHAGVLIHRARQAMAKYLAAYVGQENPP